MAATRAAALAYGAAIRRFTHSLTAGNTCAEKSDALTGSGATLFVDANGAYSRKQALAFSESFAALDVFSIGAVLPVGRPPSMLTMARLVCGSILWRWLGSRLEGRDDAHELRETLPTGWYVTAASVGEGSQVRQEGPGLASG